MNISTTKVTLWVNRSLAAALAALLFALPGLLDWYVTVRPDMRETARLAVQVSFYCCAAVVFPALWELDVLLRNILKKLVFVSRNVRAIRRVRWYCLLVALICLPAAYFYPPLVFMTIIMGFLTLILNVLGKVMAAAVEIREENDLTV